MIVHHEVGTDEEHNLVKIFQTQIFSKGEGARNKQCFATLQLACLEKND